MDVDDGEERKAAALAQIIAEGKAEMMRPAWGELIDLGCHTVRRRYEGLLKAGFTEAQALTLCVQRPQF